MWGLKFLKASLKKACDVRSRLAAMTGSGKTTTYGYDDAGRRTNAVWPNGVTAAYEYDDAGQLLGLVHRSDTATLASFEYGYDLSGGRTNMVTLEGTNSYAYDARNWLTSAAYPDGRTEEFGYDPVGNRVHLGGSGSTPTDYTYGPANRLLSSESASETNAYAYDAAGRLTNHAVNGQSRVFEYSFRSQMTSIIDTNGQVFSYAFDGDGNRISQSLNDCLHARYIYDGPNVVLELNGSNEVIHAVVNGPGIDQPVERIACVNGEPRLRQVYHTDGLGSVALMTDESKTPIKTYAYDAFGRIRSETGELVMNRWTYTGREALGDSAGLYYYRWRVMAPNTGRFTSEDPLGFVDGPNRYGYVRNRPFRYSDPMGLMGCRRELPCKEERVEQPCDKREQCETAGGDKTPPDDDDWKNTPMPPMTIPEEQPPDFPPFPQDGIGWEPEPGPLGRNTCPGNFDNTVESPMP